MQKTQVRGFSILEILISANVAALIMSNIGVADMSSSESGLKLHHAVTILNLIVMFRDLRIPSISTPVALYIFATIFTSLFGYAKYGFNIQIFNVLYCFSVSLLFAKTVRKIGYEETLRSVRAGFLVSLVSVYVKNIVIADQIIDQLRSGYRVFTWNLVAGGPNQEAAWLIMGGAFFIGTKKFWPYMAAAALLAVLYLSRGGYIAVIIIVATSIIIRAGKRTIIYAGAASTVILFLAALQIYSTESKFQIGIPIVDRTIERFYSDTDLGTEGREWLYKAAVMAFEEEQFGFGAMNATVIMGSYVGRDFPEGNVHNIYLQFLLDGGPICLLSFLIMLKHLFSNAGKLRYHSRIITFLLCYCLLGFIRFRGYDPIFYLVVGLIEGAVHVMRPAFKSPINSGTGSEGINGKS